MGATSPVADFSAGSLTVVAALPQFPGGCNIANGRECQHTRLRLAEKAPRMSPLINKVPSSTSSSRFFMTSKCTWIHRLLILRCTMMTLSDPIGCWFVIFILKTRCFLMRFINIRCRKDMFTAFGPALMLIRHFTEVVA